MYLVMKKHFLLKSNITEVFKRKALGFFKTMAGITWETGL